LFNNVLINVFLKNNQLVQQKTQTNNNKTIPIRHIITLLKNESYNQTVICIVVKSRQYSWVYITVKRITFK